MADDLLHKQDNPSSVDVISLTTEIVSAYVGNNSVKASDIPGLIREVHTSLSTLGGANGSAGNQRPAVAIAQSVTDDYLICLEDGKQFKSLKRHLRTKYDLSPEQYREKWGLPYDYPMVAPAYARQRSKLAREMGLGQTKDE